MASKSVDLPVPFSPAKKQIRLVICRASSEAIGGILKGYSSQRITCSRSSLTDLRRSISQRFRYHYVTGILLSESEDSSNCWQLPCAASLRQAVVFF